VVNVVRISDGDGVAVRPEGYVVQIDHHAILSNAENGTQLQFVEQLV
jgi:hypothetical protein